MKVETYDLRTADGRHIRKASRVLFEDGEVVAFTERMPKREAIKQAKQVRLRWIEAAQAQARERGDAK